MSVKRVAVVSVFLLLLCTGIAGAQQQVLFHGTVSYQGSPNCPEFNKYDAVKIGDDYSAMPFCSAGIGESPPHNYSTGGSCWVSGGARYLRIWVKLANGQCRGLKRFWWNGSDDDIEIDLNACTLCATP